MYPPGAVGRQVALAEWARRYFEDQLDSGRAQQMIRELAGVRLRLDPRRVPVDNIDATDQRILEAMARPRRIDEIWPLARTPRFRLLAFIHFLRNVGGIQLGGVAAHVETCPATDAARRVLGVDRNADAPAVKRAYRRLARTLHPDLHPAASQTHRKHLERRLAEVTTAYRELVTEI